jgi:hypothetical protein
MEDNFIVNENSGGVNVGVKTSRLERRISESRGYQKVLARFNQMPIAKEVMTWSDYERGEFMAGFHQDALDNLAARHRRAEGGLEIVGRVSEIVKKLV